MWYMSDTYFRLVGSNLRGAHTSSKRSDAL